MIGFIGTYLQLQSIMTAHSQWLPETHSIPHWTMSVSSSTVMNDERRTSPEWILLSIHVSSLYKFMRTRIDITISNSSRYCVLIRCNGNVLLPSNGGSSTVDCITFERVYQSTV
jgi:hypothetical protein